MTIINYVESATSIQIINIASIQIIIRKVHSDFPNTVYFTH